MEKTIKKCPYCQKIARTAFHRCETMVRYEEYQKAKQAMGNHAPAPTADKTDDPWWEDIKL